MSNLLSLQFRPNAVGLFAVHAPHGPYVDILIADALSLKVLTAAGWIADSVPD